MCMSVHYVLKYNNNTVIKTNKRTWIYLCISYLNCEYKPILRFKCFAIGKRDVFLNKFEDKNVANNVDRVKFMGTMTKWSVQKQTEEHETCKTKRRNKHLE